MPKISKIVSLPLLLLACVACSQENPKILPGQLAGFWTTDEARYADCFLELDKVYVIIGAGRQVAPSVQVIDRVEAVPAGRETIYTIHSTDLQGVEYRLRFQFSPINGGELQLSNQQGIVWRRHADEGEAREK